MLTASTLAAFAFWTIDLLSWPNVRRPEPMLLSATLSVVVGIASGAVFTVAWLAVRALSRQPSRWRHAIPIAIGTVGSLVAARQVIGTLRAAGTRPAPATIAVVTLIAVVTTSALAWGLSWASRAVGTSSERPSRRFATPALLFIVAASFVALDRAVLLPMFEKTYSFVEGLASSALTLSFFVLLSAGPRRRWVSAAVALVGIALSIAFVGSRSVRASTLRSLPSVQDEPVYAARWIRRIRQLEAFGDARIGMQRLADDYEVRVTHPDGEDPWYASAIGESATPPAVAPWNIVVFFVDTLRADVAHDRKVMPETVAWSQENLWFSRAYASGSSTVLTLAPMLGCRYDASARNPPSVFEAARASSMKTALVIPKSASDYHRASFPTFRLDHEEVVPDLDKVRRPTADELVTRSLSWIGRERPERFFLWLYQFDVHSWMDLDESYVDDQAREGGFSKTDGLPWRYLAAARGVDRAFTRFRAGLEELGVADHTVILFVSDHGEGLGQQNFWAHTTHLWESLLRVPLVLHVPGALARAWHEPVSTVDLGTTLTKLLRSPAAESTCHGEDLLAQAENAAPRRLPILFSAVIDGELARVGMLASAERKVVLDLRDSRARLLRVDGSTQEEDVTSAEPEALAMHLGQLVQTPIVPKVLR